MAYCRFIAFHGWGFDDKQWQPWADYLSDFGIFQTYDRGYFNDPKEVETLAGAVSTVIITHSLGLHWVEPTLLNQADLLVITSGFLHFHPYAAQYKRRSRTVLQETINDFEVKPETVLKKYYEDCYAPKATPEFKIEDFNHQQMIDDLKGLHNEELNIRKLKKAKKICIFHGARDKLVPNIKGRQIYTQLQYNAQYLEIKSAGHALPYTHHKQCLEFITPEIEQLTELPHPK